MATVCSVPGSSISPVSITRNSIKLWTANDADPTTKIGGRIVQPKLSRWIPVKQNHYTCNLLILLLKDRYYNMVATTISWSQLKDLNVIMMHNTIYASQCSNLRNKVNSKLWKSTWYIFKTIPDKNHPHLGKILVYIGNFKQISYKILNIKTGSNWTCSNAGNDIHSGKLSPQIFFRSSLVRDDSCLISTACELSTNM